MKGKLERFALIAEIISAFAIVISLIFVGVEVHRNTEAQKASTYQSMIELSTGLLTTIAENRELAELIGADRDELDAIDQRRSGAWLRLSWRRDENAFVQYSRGVVGENEWLGYRSLMCGGTLDSTWERHWINLSPDFVEFIESCNEPYVPEE